MAGANYGQRCGNYLDEHHNHGDGGWRWRMEIEDGDGGWWHYIVVGVDNIRCALLLLLRYSYNTIDSRY